MTSILATIVYAAGIGSIGFCAMLGFALVLRLVRDGFPS